jgi:choline dehydrogenase-like flavoprotein
MSVLPGPALAAAIDKTHPVRLESPRGFDAIVVGAGASGGLAALQLTAWGLEVLVLDAGMPRNLLTSPLAAATAALGRGLADPRRRAVLPQGLGELGWRALARLGRLRQPVQSRCPAWPSAPDAFVSDRRRPYGVAPGEAFDWFRVERLGGRMALAGHGRQHRRMEAGDLQPTDGLGPAWPLDAEELAPWYDYVEELLGVVGGLGSDLPLERLIQADAAERQALAALRRRWPALAPTIGRFAPAMDMLEIAAASGRLFCRQGAVVAEVEVDAGGVTRGVAFVDWRTRRRRTARAPLVFLCASALESTRILMASRPPAGPLGQRSGALGRYLMDHVLVSGEGTGGGLPDEAADAGLGRCLHLPRLDLREGAAGTVEGARGFGAELRRRPTGRGRSWFSCQSYAEMLPRRENRAVLDRERRDAFGLPTLAISCRHSPAELAQADDQARAVRELGELFGVKFSRLLTRPAPPGSAGRECGGARMGEDPRRSVLDPDNQCWDARGLYVTDGACFPSQGPHGPALTIMALTARACAQATSGGLGHLMRKAAGTAASLA